MANDIRLLEDLVNKAVDRLKRLSLERNKLQQEVDSLRQELEALNRARATAGADASDWEAQRINVVSELRTTLEELRGD